MTRHLVIGDIHGCSNALSVLADYVGFRTDDTIVTLGDYVDRGPDARGVLDFMIDLGKRHKTIALRGNHELMMLDARDKNSWMKPWLSYGGDATLRSYAATKDAPGNFTDVPDSHWDFLQNQLQPYYETDSHIFVHAFTEADKPLSEQSDANLYWRKFLNPQAHSSGKTVICGHSPQESGKPLNYGHSICIDTGVHGDGWLTCLDADSGMVWQANEAGETRSFELGEPVTGTG